MLLSTVVVLSSFTTVVNDDVLPVGDDVVSVSSDTVEQISRDMEVLNEGQEFLTTDWMQGLSSITETLGGLKETLVELKSDVATVQKRQETLAWDLVVKNEDVADRIYNQLIEAIHDKQQSQDRATYASKGYQEAAELERMYHQPTPRLLAIHTDSYPMDYGKYRAYP